MKYYTGTGDDGKTTMRGEKDVPKDAPVIEAYGTLDEVEACIGLALAQLENEEVEDLLLDIQNSLHIASTELAGTQDKAIEQRHVDELERICEEYGEKVPELESFILAGGSGSGAALHMARTIARRAERRITSLDQDVSDEMLAFINRLSSALFVLARYINHLDGYEERSPDY